MSTSLILFPGQLDHDSLPRPQFRQHLVSGWVETLPVGTWPLKMSAVCSLVHQHPAQSRSWIHEESGNKRSLSALSERLFFLGSLEGI